MVDGNHQRSKMISQKFLDDAKEVELKFATQHLKDFIFATKE